MNRLKKIGSILIASVMIGLLLAIVSVLFIFPGSKEPVITGSIMLGFGVGWLLLATLSTKYTDQPQKWAYVPAAYFGVVGLLLVTIQPGRDIIATISWVWPVILAGLVIWMFLQARNRLHSKTRCLLLYPVFIVLALVAIGGFYERVLERTHKGSVPFHGQLVDVGGYRLHIDCSGSGEPTVVLESGLGEPSSAMGGLIAPAVTSQTRVCTYDREGRGWSDEAPYPLDGQQTASALHTLLSGTGVKGPIILGGHSAGGVYVLNYAHLYPDEVAGVVLLDSMTPRQYENIEGWSSFYSGYKTATALMQTLYRVGAGRLIYASAYPDFPTQAQNEERAFLASPNGSRSQRDEFSVIRKSLDQAKELKTLDNRPLYVLTAENGTQGGWHAEQDKLAKLSTNSVHKVALGSTHTMFVDNRKYADISSQAILAVVQASRNNTQLAK